MESEKVAAETVRVGDPVKLTGLAGWWFVESVDRQGEQVVIGLVPIDRGDAVTHTMAADQSVHRGARDAVHRAEEFIGLTEVEARVWAAALGWRLFGPHDLLWGADSQRHDAVRVWTDDSGTVVRASFF